MDRRILFCACGILLVFGSQVEARKWTDVAGNQISAEYVRIHEGEVILRQGSRVVKCPYDQFSEQDRAYIRQQMDAEREKEGRRTGLNPVGVPAASEGSDDDARELRTWRDLQGNKVLAQYVGFSVGRVELLKDGTRLSYRYEAFSPGDQAYVAQILLAEGRGDEIPKKTPVGDEGRPAAPPVGGGGYHEGSNATPGSLAPGYEVTNIPTGPPYAGGHGNTSEYEVEHSSEPSQFFPTTQPATPPPPSNPPISPPVMHAPSYTSTTQLAWACSGCNRELPDNIKAGDYCPYCHAYLSWLEDENGTKSYAGYSNRRWTRSVIKLGILGIFAVVGALGTLFRRSFA